MMERQGSEDLLPQVTSEILTSISDELLNMGVAIVGIKLGEYGLYVRTSPNPERLRAMNGWASSEETIVSWTGRELVAPCFQVLVAGTTGAGDCTIAGLLASFAQEEPIERALLAAVGVGACNAERADAVSGIRPWDEIQRRIEGGWEQRNVHPNVAAEFSKRSKDGLWER
jgi:sugar/nucleoside kinase (ribokinase family)